jgi:hypothetical protein
MEGNREDHLGESSQMIFYGVRALINNSKGNNTPETNQMKKEQLLGNPVRYNKLMCKNKKCRSGFSLK